MTGLIKVGMADLKVIKAPGTLTTLGLGSCIGICVLDSRAGVAGMAHIMLPDSTAVRNNSNEAKFADSAMIVMLKEMEKLGASRSRMTAKIAGGAQMFAFSKGNDMMKVGDRNAEAVRKILKENRIPLKADETGGNFGRTIEFNSENGVLFIKTIGHGTKEV